MHITTRPVASIQKDSKEVFSVVAHSLLLVVTTNPFNAVKAAITLQQQEDKQQEEELLTWLG